MYVNADKFSIMYFNLLKSAMRRQEQGTGLGTFLVECHYMSWHLLHVRMLISFLCLCDLILLKSAYAWAVDEVRMP